MSERGGEYVVVQRQEGKPGGKQLMAAAQRAADEDHRLLGFFGVNKGHLPFRTADGRYNPAADMSLSGTKPTLRAISRRTQRSRR